LITNLIICGILGVIGAKLNYFINVDIDKLFGIDATIMYLPTFIIGTLLAKYRNNIIDIYNKRLNLGFKIILSISSVLLYTYTWLLPNIPILHNGLFNEGATVLGASLFIAISLSSKKASFFLSKPILVFFGEISFSLFLYHFVVLLTFLFILYGKMHSSLILILAFVISVLVSYISYKYIETPSNNFAKVITANYKRNNKTKIQTIKKELLCTDPQKLDLKI